MPAGDPPIRLGTTTGLFIDGDRFSIGTYQGVRLINANADQLVYGDNSVWYPQQPVNWGGTITIKEHVRMGKPDRTPRIVDVYIVDLDENLRIADRLVFHTKEPVFTNKTDEELLLDADIIEANTRDGDKAGKRSITEVLAAHNEKRAKTKDRLLMRQHGRDVWLEPVDIGDLAVRIITRAEF